MGELVFKLTSQSKVSLGISFIKDLFFLTKRYKTVVNPALFGWIQFCFLDLDPWIQVLLNSLWKFGDLYSYFLKILQGVPKLWIFCHTVQILAQIFIFGDMEDWISHKIGFFDNNCPTLMAYNFGTSDRFQI